MINSGRWKRPFQNKLYSLNRFLYILHIYIFFTQGYATKRTEGFWAPKEELAG